MQIVFPQPETLMRKTVMLSLLCAGAVSAEVSLTKLPHREFVSIGMESASVGTELSHVHGITNSEGLLRDLSIPAYVSGGKNHMTVRFCRQSVFEKISFLNDGMEGDVKLFVSPDAKNWQPVGSGFVQAKDRQFVVNPGSTFGKYLKFELDVIKSGTIRCLRILGSAKDSQFQILENREGLNQRINFADGIGGGRMVYATHSTEISKGLTVVYDLTQSRWIDELVSLHSAQAVNLRIHAVDKLPERENWRGHLEVDADSLLQPLNQIAEMKDLGQGVARVTLKSQIRARYVAFSWTDVEDIKRFVSYDIGILGPCKISEVEGDVKLSLGETSSDPFRQSVAGESIANQEILFVSAFISPSATVETNNEARLAAPAFYQQYVDARELMMTGNAFGNGASSEQYSGKSSRYSAGGRAKTNEEGEVEAEEEDEFPGPPVFLDWSLAPSAP